MREMQSIIELDLPESLANIMSGRATAIFVGAGSPTIPANN
jgi:hypothetical protein